MTPPMPERKPLELVVYAPGDELPPAPKASLLFHTFAHGPGCPGWGCHPKHKRLTDAELAAEWWRETAILNDICARPVSEDPIEQLMTMKLAEDRCSTLERFASYDDEGLT